MRGVHDKFPQLARHVVCGHYWNRLNEMQLDTFDARLLFELQRDNRKTSAQLSQVVHLSPAACLRRVERLRRNGVITADISIVAPEKTGVGVQALVRVSLEAHRPETLAGFEAAAMGAEEVTACWHISGGADYTLMVAARDMAAYEAFLRGFLVENPLVRSYEANIVIGAVKQASPVPVYLPQGVRTPERS